MASRFYAETFPLTSRIRFEFPERDGLPPLKFWWYDGNPTNALKPLRPGCRSFGGNHFHDGQAAWQRRTDRG